MFIYILLIIVEVPQEHFDLLMQKSRTEPVDEEDSIDREILEKINRGSLMTDPTSGGKI